MTKRPGLYFRAGDAVNPGLFLDGVRIAWWPAYRKLPDQTTASRVLIAYENKGSVLTREEIAALTEDESSD